MVRNALLPPRLAGLVTVALQAGHHRDGLSPAGVSTAGHVHATASSPTSFGFVPAPLRSLFDESPTTAPRTATGYRVSRIAASNQEVEQLKFASEQLKIAAKKLKEGRGIIQDLQADLLRENAELKSKLQEQEKLELENRELKSKLQDQEKLKLENKELKEEAQAVKADRDAVQDKLWKLFSQTEELKSETQDMKSDLETIKERNEQLELENKELEERLEAATSMAQDNVRGIEAWSKESVEAVSETDDDEDYDDERKVLAVY